MLREKIDLLSIVVPVFNEEESINETVRRLRHLENLSERLFSIEFIFVDDGCQDNTLEILKSFAKDQLNIKIISLSRNFGHQIAITAGIDIAQGNFVAVIDADLQDPPELIRDMYLEALNGYDVVYGKRRTRDGETIFKKITSACFYRIFNWMTEIKIPNDTGDFRLMSRRAVDALKRMPERHRFVRGMVTWLGYKAIAFEYDRDERYAGVTKYPLKKMIMFAINAFLSFSSKPLAIAIRLGLFIIILGLAGALYMLYLKIFTNVAFPGLTAVLISIAIFGGAQILLIGIVGQYIARIFEETKNRPLYFIADRINI
jgi:glycosyltransferase involved in cell wall biosynthesis